MHPEPQDQFKGLGRKVEKPQPAREEWQPVADKPHLEQNANGELRTVDSLTTPTPRSYVLPPVNWSWAFPVAWEIVMRGDGFEVKYAEPLKYPDIEFPGCK